MLSIVYTWRRGDHLGPPQRSDELAPDPVDGPPETGDRLQTCRADCLRFVDLFGGPKSEELHAESLIRFSLAAVCH
ncbi:hypothetical protein NHX12_007247 [Muraenolepis orangiensis]|uniref:Uncharacterized protein n=1 Tax=Muraenolepis orangiensis TaxID=630683 RepID=A0A9Q0DPJ5_9TELE|nr:hypothetical protein NHX12_007247 [Muraenolepis orangiensis]